MMLFDKQLIRLSFLIVDDEKSACNMISRMVSWNFPESKIYTAGNGVEGVELFREYTPDIVITDINMQVMDGIEMAREIRATNTKATFIVVTARSDKKTYDKFMEIGCCAYLLKPLNYMDLFAAVETCRPGQTG